MPHFPPEAFDSKLLKLVERKDYIQLVTNFPELKKMPREMRLDLAPLKGEEEVVSEEYLTVKEDESVKKEEQKEEWSDDEWHLDGNILEDEMHPVGRN
jgi:hypothetical protein